MHGLRKLPELVESIYDAGLDPSLWNNAVAGIRDFVGGQACGLFSKDSISKFGVTHYYCGADPRYIQLYSETYSKFDPLTVLPPHGEIVSIPDLVNFDEYRKGRFYQEWMQPQGCSDAANVVLEKSSCPVMMTVLSGRRMVDPAMKHRLSLIVPHASRALLINRAITAQLTLATALADVLDNLASGIFLLDASCRVVHANSAGHALLAADDVVRSVAGQLVTSSAEANQTLREAFATGNDVVLLAARDRAIPLLSPSGERYVAHILPLSSVLRNGSERVVNAAGALLLRKVSLGGQSYGELIARTFDLTPAELRVFLSIVEIGGIPETAAALGIAETTAKTHLHRVFAKTGVSRQADLVKLPAGFSNPLVN
ncbi:helix-turn-helix transcriptional regulator [Bradyrhizobium japonicum]|uniref:helix-turn-helix transcriptional regulator n=1 Tax=Bradyrhizobium japonicum TaxID=375 RepID=UPI00209F6F73|nr:helix-turn-helix transcriptional regulator [Bradyrhizobium japonicum]MCP1766952.1 DNA-binding CsgD family transcriptional regulator [Bradyrhizobium japonicum]MCP1789091.1 DNA-binding CsgD family transcriptional regulator [Bradyrhizobium japonicum]MCP1801590.1 DNA-binding CsgD family transcriptional regulator [Bradyrhizobium japonicum]MCP1819899.1 DNA-binding CsgD family transcriptional regulator [Bradyrhizobium japonicum]MCP1868591.1 DNA-binding CsgD family transcriptional regulator [Bradyr